MKVEMKLKLIGIHSEFYYKKVKSQFLELKNLVKKLK